MGTARTVPVLRLTNGEPLTDPLDTPWRVDRPFPGTLTLIRTGSARTITDWRNPIAPVLQHL